MDKKKFVEDFKKKLRTLRVGNTVHVFTEECREKVEAAVERDLRTKGVSRHDEDGSKTFITDEVVHPYVWDNSGDRIKCNRMRVTVKDGKTVEKKFERAVYKHWDTVFG